MAREGCAGFCSAQTYITLLPPEAPSRAQLPSPSPPPPARSSGTRRKRNEQLFLVQLPALCQMYSHLRYNCQPSLIRNEL